jgi:hypothetical protein
MIRPLIDVPDVKRRARFCKTPTIVRYSDHRVASRIRLIGNGFRAVRILRAGRSRLGAPVRAASRQVCDGPGHLLREAHGAGLAVWLRRIAATRIGAARCSSAQEPISTIRTGGAASPAGAEPIALAVARARRSVWIMSRRDRARAVSAGHAASGGSVRAQPLGPLLDRRQPVQRRHGRWSPARPSARTLRLPMLICARSSFQGRVTPIMPKTSRSVYNIREHYPATGMRTTTCFLEAGSYQCPR